MCTVRCYLNKQENKNNFQIRAIYITPSPYCIAFSNTTVCGSPRSFSVPPRDQNAVITSRFFVILISFKYNSVSRGSWSYRE